MKVSSLGNKSELPRRLMYPAMGARSETILPRTNLRWMGCTGCTNVSVQRCLFHQIRWSQIIGGCVLSWFCVCVCSFLTSSSSSSSSTSRIPVSCSDSGLTPIPARIAAGAAFLPRRPSRTLGWGETELSSERCSWAWRTKQKSRWELHGGPTDYFKPALFGSFQLLPTFPRISFKSDRREFAFRRWRNFRAKQWKLFDFHALTPKPDVVW